MSDRQETVADVLAKMRNFACVGKGHEGTCSDIIESYADRIEAAWEREECSRRGAEAQSGDAASLREALEQLSDKVCDYLQKGLIQLPLPIEGLLKQARDALAAPARQCDVGTAQEQIKRWEEFCLEHHDYWMPSTSLTEIQRCNCPCLEGNGCNYFIWAQMPYEKGGEK